MGKHRRSSTFLPLLLLAAPLLAPSACGKSDAPNQGPGLPGGIFGGASGVQQPQLAGESSLGGADAGTTPIDVCQSVPQGTRALVDDFEDGDSVALPETDREAYWFTIHDDSAGMIDPDTQFLPVPGGAHGSALAAHITASGYSVWGAGFAANISQFAGGIRCPYNASKFSGLRFFARGKSQVRVELLIPEIVDQQFGGKCNPNAGQVCYDTHGVSISPTEDWKLYSFPWSAFTQRNFGTQAAFRPDAIMSIQYSFEIGDLPADVWFDDVAFEDGSAPPSNEPTGEGGAAGAPPGDAGAGAENIGGASSSAGQGGM